MDDNARTYPLKRPKNHRPPIPRWQLHLPKGTEEIYTAYIGVQRHSTDTESNQVAGQAISHVQAWVAGEIRSSSLTSESFTVLDGDIQASTVWVCYWLHEQEFKESLKRLSLPAIHAALPPEARASIGLWCEHFVTPASRLETNYTGLDYLPGLGRLPRTTTSEHDLTAYWGAARDRIPGSAHDLFERGDDAVTAPPEQVPKGLGQHSTGQSYENMVHIRSGQFWQSCSEVESQAYEEKLEPALETGLEYLWQNPEESGAMGVRYLRNTVEVESKNGVNVSGNGHTSPRKETCAAGFFRSLGDLEKWPKKHPSHLQIYRGAMQHAKEFGPERKFRTWHEVSVLRKGDARFEYVNCRPETGVIRFVPLESVPLDEGM